MEKRVYSYKMVVAAEQNLKEREYWLKKFAGELTKSTFFYDYHREDTNHRQMNVERFRFSEPLISKLMKLSGGKDTEIVDVKLHMILVTGLFIVLHKYRDRYKETGDIMIGSPLLKQDLEQEFINTVLVFKNAVRDETTFKDLLLEIRETIIRANENQNFPMEVLMDQLNLPQIGRESPLFDVVVILENLYDKGFIQGIHYNMSFSFLRTSEGIVGEVEYNAALYREATIKQIIRHYLYGLGQALREVNVKISGIDIMSEEERKQVLVDFNNNRTDYTIDKTMPELFAEQAALTPHAIALVGPSCTTPPETGKHQLTYRQMDQYANQLAQSLIGKGVKADTIVALRTVPSLERMVSIIAIWKAAGAYLPIDTNYPRERIDYMLKDSGTQLLVTTGDRAKEGEAERSWEGENYSIDELFRSTNPLSYSQLSSGDLASPVVKNFLPAAGSRPPVTSLAYIIYTSGTTGKPKGVMVEQQNVTAYLQAFNREFAFGPRDTVIQLSSYAFDVFVEEVFPLLLKGGKVLIPDFFELLDFDSLVSLIILHEVSIIDCTPLLLNEINKYIQVRGNSSNGVRIRTIISGGDVLKRNYVENLLKIARVYNTYGPTETTVCAAYYQLKSETQPAGPSSSVPIGKPITNYSVYLLDENHQPVPTGILGELCISGPGITRGYLNRPGLTAERFVDYRSYRSHGSYFSYLSYSTYKKLYKTGDLARWLPEGNIEFAGRKDHQVKIRGYRIETGEIENHLLKIPGIIGAVVAAREDNHGDKYLCAYLVCPREITGDNGIIEPDQAQELSVSGIRQKLSQYLPDYMIPSYFVKVESIPLTPNGKADLKSLPGPDPVMVTKYVAPRDEIEEKLVRIWAQVLKIERDIIGIDASFFDLGGHSLKATTMISFIFKELQVKISLGEVFKSPSIRRLAEYIKETGSSNYHPLQLVEKREYYPVSYAQRRLWILCQFEADSTAYNMPAALVVSGKLEPDIFQRVLHTLIQRHENLRTVFIKAADGEPKQKILKEMDVKLEVVDLVEMEKADREEKAREISVKAASHVFDLGNGPLLLVKLLRLEEEKFLLLCNVHHIVNDAWSQGVIIREALLLYFSILENKGNPLPLLKYQYKDYTLWHNDLVAQGGFNFSEEYWLKKFSDKPNGVELPTDFPRRAIQSFNGRRITAAIDQEKTTRLEQLAIAHEATLFMSLINLVNIFLYRYSGQKDILIGAPIAGRKQVELQDMVGFLVNTLVYRNNVQPEENFIRLLGKVKEETLACFEYQDYPFDLLVERLELQRDLSQSPLFNVMLAHNNTDDAKAGDGRMIEAPQSDHIQQIDFNMSKFDLIFFIDKRRDMISLTFEYNSDLFKHSTAQRMVTNFFHLVASVLENPEAPVSLLDFLDEAEYETVVHGFNETRNPFPEITIQEMVEQQVEKKPQQTAIVYGAEHISYDELNQRANQLAHFLRREHQVKPNDIIGVLVERSVVMIISILGIIKSGAGYVSIDPNYPPERIRHILENSQTDLILIDRENSELLGGYRGQCIDIRRDWQQISSCPGENPSKVNQKADVVYVIYTSGTTGIPNGAMLSQETLSNLVKWQQDKTTIDSSLRCLQFTSINFCVSFQEIFITLCSGGQVHLIGDMERQDVEYLMEFISRYKIQILYLPFSYLNFLFNESSRWGESFKHSLEHIITAGEQLKITSGLKQFLERNPRLQLHNHYGSSEMHVVSSYTLDAAEAAKHPLPPAGQPISNTRIYFLDNDDNIAPLGVWGELCVAGCSEISGYINNQSLTDKKLVSIPGLSENNIRLYRSGDIGRWREDGNIELKGRKDFQVKIHGFRVEPGEIESKITMMERVKDCVVVVREWNFEKYLVAYVVLDNITPRDVTRTIRSYLPQHMIPLIIELDALPLMPNGKVDREKLPEPAIKPDENYVAPRNEVEEKMMKIWAEILKIEKDLIGINANFFDLGGHSLKATVLAARIHKEFNVDIPLAEIFKAPTIEELGYLVTALAWSNTPNREVTADQEIEEIII